MARHIELGRLGEEEATLYLARNHYTILDRNARIGHLEIDIIAERWGEVVFVEVKTRSDETFRPALEAVTPLKKARLSEAAVAYLQLHRLDCSPFRFDIITLVGSQPPFRLTHYEDAYRLSGRRKGRTDKETLSV